MPPRGRIAARRRLRAAQNDTTLGPARGGEQRGTGRAQAGPSLLGPRADGGLRGRGRRVLGGPFSGARRAALAQMPREAREASSSLTSRWPETPRVPQHLNLPPQIQGHGPETTLAASLNLGVGGRGVHARPTFVAGHGQPRSDPDASPPLPSPARRLRAERAGAARTLPFCKTLGAVPKAIWATCDARLLRGVDGPSRQVTCSL